MSKFIGPIHHWLYAKIGKQEALTRAIAEYAQKEGWLENAASCVKELTPLETVIDAGDIHGWLQARINDAETRYANLVCAILEPDAERLDVLLQIACAFGRQNALTEESDAQAVYQEFENFFVNGMPCDRINVITRKDAAEVAWEMTQDIHARYWTACRDGSRPYYQLRKSVMDGLLHATNLRVVMTDAAHYAITRQ